MEHLAKHAEAKTRAEAGTAVTTFPESCQNDLEFFCLNKQASVFKHHTFSCTLLPRSLRQIIRVKRVRAICAVSCCAGVSVLQGWASLVTWRRLDVKRRVDVTRRDVTRRLSLGDADDVRLGRHRDHRTVVFGLKMHRLR